MNMVEVTDQETRILNYVAGSLGRSIEDIEDFVMPNIKASEIAVKGRIGSDETFYVDNFLYELAVAQLAVSNYMNRSASTDVNLYNTENGFQDYILDLKADYWVKHTNGGDTDGTA